MGNIRERQDASGKVRYQARVTLKGAPPQTGTFDRLTDARKWVAKTETEIRDGKHFGARHERRRTVTELIEKYKAEVLPHKKDGANQARQLDWWAAELGAMPIYEVRPDVVAGLKAKLLHEVDENGALMRKPATVVRYLAAMSHVFTVAVREWKWARENPVRDVSRPKEPRGRVRFLSEDEVSRLLSACRESSHRHLHLVVVLALATGMRHGEIAKLRWRDVDFKRRSLTLIDTKNGDTRVVPVRGLALELLTAYSEQKKVKASELFPGATYKGWLRKPWLAALKVAYIEDFRFHDLRHTTASYLAMNGASPREIAEVLGHKTLQMAMRYSHLSEPHTGELLDKVGGRIFQSDKSSVSNTTEPS